MSITAGPWVAHDCPKKQLVFRPSHKKQKMIAVCTGCDDKWDHLDGEELYRIFALGYKACRNDVKKSADTLGFSIKQADDLVTPLDAILVRIGI